MRGAGVRRGISTWNYFLVATPWAIGCSTPTAPTRPAEAPAPIGSAPAATRDDAPTTPDAAFRRRPPPGTSEAGFSVPIPFEERLPNGLRVLVLETRGAPLVALHVLVSRGVDQAAPAVGGLAGAMLLRGTRTRSATELSDAFEALGATYGAGADHDSTGMQATVLASEAPKALAIMADVLRNPAFADDELSRARSRRVAALAEERDDPRAALRDAVAEALYPAGHPYHASALGGEAALARVTRSDLLRFHEAHVRPDVTTVVVAGAIDRDRALEAVKAAFGAWRGRAARATSVREPAPRRGEARVVIVDRPGATQTQVAIAAPGAARTSKDHDALMVLAAVLGRRINGELRERRGATYGVSAQFAFRQGPGPFTAGGPVVREQTTAAVRVITGEIERLREQPISAGELADVRKILGAISARFETARASAASLAPVAIFGLSVDEYLTRRVRLQMITPEVLQRAAAAYLRADRLKVVLVGDASAIVEGVRALDLGPLEVRARPASAPPGATTPGPAPPAPTGDEPTTDEL
jgi:zinc protease